ncbi:MAG: hypothetical protein SGARI_002178, partial [Bacillariaceae sp.]
PQLERVVSPDAVIDGVDKNSTGESPAAKKLKTVPPASENQNRPSGDAATESPTASTIQKETNKSTESTAVNATKVSILNDNEVTAPDQDEQPPSQPEGHSQPLGKEKKQEEQAPPQQAQQPQQIPAIVDQETPPTSSTSTPPSSPGSAVNRTNPSGGGLKEAPPYSYKPELTKQLINQPIKPEQAASQTYLESFLRAKQKFKERADQRRENRKFHLKKRSRLDAALEAPPLLRNDLNLHGNASSRYFHSMKGNILGPSTVSGGGQYQLYADQSVPASPVLNRDWRDSGHSAAGDNLPILLNSGNNNRPVLTNYGGKNLSLIDQEKSLNHPYGPHRQDAPIPDKASPTASLVATEEPSVTLKDLTNDGKGAEWTCVFSGVAQTSSDEFDTASFEEHLQRLLGYRLLFEGGKQEAKSSGDECLMLLPKDERTRMANGIKKMDGTLERRGDTYSTDPSVPLSPVLCFGWRPNKDGRADDYGLDDFWSDPLGKKDVSEGEAHSVQVTFEGHTGNGDHPWCEYFPFGSLFGLDMQYNAEVVELQDNYWSHGIVVVFHWMGEEQNSRKTGMVKEFALFVPSSEVRPEDVRIDTAPFTCYYSPEYSDV